MPTIGGCLCCICWCLVEATAEIVITGVSDGASCNNCGRFNNTYLMDIEDFAPISSVSCCYSAFDLDKYVGVTPVPCDNLSGTAGLILMRIGIGSSIDGEDYQIVVSAQKAIGLFYVQMRWAAYGLDKIITLCNGGLVDLFYETTVDGVQSTISTNRILLLCGDGEDGDEGTNYCDGSGGSVTVQLV